MQPISYFRSNQPAYIEQLKMLCRIPSVSLPGSADPSVLTAAAQAVASLFSTCGMTDTKLIPIDDSAPYIVSRIGNNPQKPTYLWYAHYDVQPAGDESAWTSPPFGPEVRKDRLYGRGTADDKAGIVLLAALVDAYHKTQTELPINIIALIEGEEESGSFHLEPFLKTYAHHFQHCQGVFVADGGNLDTGVPSLITSLRGAVHFTVEVAALTHKVHSGMFGGPIPDPVMALGKMLATLINRDGTIAIPRMYDDVLPVPAKIRAHLKRTPLTEKRLRTQAEMLPGVTFLQKRYSILESLWHRPSLAVNAIQASSRAQAGNIICDRAWCRMGIRTVKNMNPKKVYTQAKRFLEKQAPWGCHVTITPDGEHAEPWLADIGHPLYTATMGALTLGYGKKPFTIGSGGSIPIVHAFERHLNRIPVVIFGVEDPYSHIHGEDESVSLTDFVKTGVSIIHLFDKLGEASLTRHPDPGLDPGEGSSRSRRDSSPGSSPGSE